MLEATGQEGRRKEEGRAVLPITSGRCSRCYTLQQAKYALMHRMQIGTRLVCQSGCPCCVTRGSMYVHSETDSESVASGGQIAVCASPADRLFLKRVTLICHMELHLSLLIKLTTLCVHLQLLQQIVNKPPRQNSINLSDSRIRVKLALCSRAHGCALCRGLVVASRRGTHAHGLPSHSAPGPIPSHPIYCCGLLTEYSLSLSSPS